MNSNTQINRYFLTVVAWIVANGFNLAVKFWEVGIYDINKLGAGKGDFTTGNADSDRLMWFLVGCDILLALIQIGALIVSAAFAVIHILRAFDVIRQSNFGVYAQLLTAMKTNVGAMVTSLGLNYEQPKTSVNIQPGTAMGYPNVVGSGYK